MAEEEKKAVESKEEIQEQKQEEPKKEDINSLFPGAVLIEKPNKDSKPYEEAIEQARVDFNKVVKKSRIRSYIAMGVVLALAVTSVIFIGFRGLAWSIAGWSLVGTAVVGMIVFYIVTRNTVPNATKDYIDVVNRELNQRNFADNQFTEAKTDKKEKLEIADPISDGLLLDDGR